MSDRFCLNKIPDSVAIGPDGTICISCGAEEKIPPTLADEHFVSVKSSESLVVSNFRKTYPRWIFFWSLCILEMIEVGRLKVDEREFGKSSSNGAQVT